jgi:hypothetical protein
MTRIISSTKISLFIATCAISGGLFGAVGLVMTTYPAHARSNCQYFPDREPRCITTSDGAGQPYTDGRTQRNTQWWERRMDYHHRFNEGRNHTSDMATGGTDMGRSGVVSPYVPGSVQDKGWESERKRRGLCGDDRRCLSAQ